MWKTVNDIIGFLANWFEVLGFVIGIFVAIKVFFINKEIQELNRRHLYHQRIDEHLTELKIYSRELANSIPNYQVNIKEIRLVAATCRVNCESLKKKVKKKELINLINNLDCSRIKKLFIYISGSGVKLINSEINFLVLKIPSPVEAISSADFTPVFWP